MADLKKVETRRFIEHLKIIGVDYFYITTLRVPFSYSPIYA